MPFYGRVNYYDWDGVSDDYNEQEALGNSMTGLTAEGHTAHTLMMRNHGGELHVGSEPPPPPLLVAHTHDAPPPRAQSQSHPPYDNSLAISSAILSIPPPPPPLFRTSSHNNWEVSGRGVGPCVLSRQDGEVADGPPQERCQD